jgi:hypothetical protein
MTKLEIIKFAQGVGVAQDVYDWLDRIVFVSDKQYEQSEIEHILDYLASYERPKKLERATYEQMKKNAEKWNKSLIKKGEAIKESNDDTKVVLDFKDGFKFVKLVGRKAYEREGFLMRHCVGSYFGKNEEIYSLRDSENIPHATLSSNSQQIKGKGNGVIHPKYINYVVEFLEHLGVEVKDSEMKNIGYVNVKTIKDDNIKWDNLFRKKYFPKNKVGEIKNKKGDPYQSVTLWKPFSLNLNNICNFNFNISLSTFINSNQKINKNDSTVAGGDYSTVVGGDSSTVAGGDASTVAGRDYSTVAGRNYSTVAGGDYSTVAGRNYSTMAGRDYSTVAGRNYSTVAGGDDSTVAGGNDSTVAGRDSSTVAGRNYSTVAGRNYSTVVGGDYSTVAGRNYSTVVGGDDSTVAGRDGLVLVGGNNTIVVGRINCMAMAGINSVIVLAYMLKNDIQTTTIVIDGIKYKENTLYKLDDIGGVVEVEMTEAISMKLRTVKEAKENIDNLAKFYD